MPCYTVRYTSLDLKAADREALRSALESLGMTIAGVSNGVITAWYNGTTVTVYADSIRVERGMEGVVSQIKREYARKVQEKVARKNGWRVQYTNKEKTRGRFIKQ